MKKMEFFQFQKLTNKQLKTVKGGEDSPVDESLNEDGTPRTKDGTIVPPRN
ncbi:bacteriocin [Flavobacterium sp. J27]|uniref:bacteriocin n=1 Tax=Flavobacterium sp. J27 TaxID=2060419 RepID=UPI00102F8D9B|nr:bacteriocin [Flavobacterium sp. J27]